jgi:outer membrane usher protein FimD/PapC
MPKVGFVFNEKDLSVEITASPELLPKREIDFLSSRHPKVFFPKGNSAFLNYRLNYSDSNNSDPSEQMTNQLGIRLGEVLLMSDSSYTKTAIDERFVRLMSNLTYDRQVDMQRLVVGDQFAASGELGNSVNIGGIGFSKVYRMNPYFSKNPLLTLSGMISLPSEVEIYLNGVRIRREKLSPGEFELKNISYYGGAGDVEVVIRDAFGRVERIKYPFYFTDMLLKKGLYEYSYNLGALRNMFGIESDQYGDTVFSGFQRYGLTDSLTVGLRAEGEANGFYNIGPQLAYNIDNKGIATLSLSKSAGDSEHRGDAWSFTYGFQKRNITARLIARGFTENYSMIGTGNITEKTKIEQGAGIGYGFGDIGNISIDLSTTKKYSGVDKQVATVSFSKNISRFLSGSITYKNILEQDSDNEIFLGLNYNTDGDLSVAGNYHKSRVEDTILLQAQKNLPVGVGLGYRATLEKRETESSSSYIFNPVLQYNEKYGLYEGEYRGNYNNDTNIRDDYYQLSASGAVVYAGNTFGLMRPVNDSFGLVQVGQLSGIRVLHSGEEVGSTGSKGKLFVPNLGSYYDNAISIDDKGIGMDYNIPEVQKYVSPSFRSGVLIDFAVSKFQAVTGKLHIITDGKKEPVEFYEVTLLEGETEINFPTGKDGEFYLENLKYGDYRAEFSYKGSQCSFMLKMPASEDPIVDIGEVICDRIKQ